MNQPNTYIHNSGTALPRSIIKATVPVRQHVLRGNLEGDESISQQSTDVSVHAREEALERGRDEREGYGRLKIDFFHALNR